MNARSTEMRKPTGKMRKQKPCLLAENTKMNTRFTEMRKQTGKMRKQKPCLLAETTQMSKQNGKTRKQTDKTRKQMAILPIAFLIKRKNLPIQRTAYPFSTTIEDMDPTPEKSQNIPNPIEQPGLRIHTLCHHRFFLCHKYDAVHQY
jgi:hypothetical protein